MVQVVAAIASAVFMLHSLSCSALDIELFNADTIFTAKKGEFLTLGVQMSDQEQKRFLLNESLINPLVCIVIDGAACDCYMGRLNQIYMPWRHGCISELQKSQSTPKKGIYLSLSLLADNEKPISSSPLFIPNPNADLMEYTTVRNKITLVLPLFLDDLTRSTLLLSSLSTISSTEIHELLIVTPLSQHGLICGAVKGIQEHLEIAFSIRCESENKILPTALTTAGKYSGYAVQMAVKLLVAKILVTDFYITLDADIICLHPDIILRTLVTSSYISGGTGQQISFTRGVYHFESAYIHESWWEGSSQILNISHQELQKVTSYPQIISTSMDVDEESKVGMGVTPAVLSTFGSLLTVGEIIKQIFCAQYGYHVWLETVLQSDDFKELRVEPNKFSDIKYNPNSLLSSEFVDSAIKNWILSLGNPPYGLLWSEYTLYRLTLAKYHVFHNLHIDEIETLGSISPIYLHCNNVWYADQWPWDANSAYANTSCLFSVVQSTSDVPVSKVFSLMRL